MVLFFLITVIARAQISSTFSSISSTYKIRSFFKVLEDVEPFRLSSMEKFQIKLLLHEWQMTGSLNLENIKDKYQSLINSGKVFVSNKKYESFEEYLVQEASSWPRTGDLTADIKRIEEVGLELIEPEFTDESVKKVWEQNKTNKTDFLKKTSLFAYIELLKMANTSSGSLTGSVDKTTIEEHIVNIEKDLNQAVKESLGELFSKEKKQFISQAFPELLSIYFRRSSLKMKLNMFSDLLDNSFPYEKENLIMAYFSNSGPQFQKLIQSFSKEESIDKKWQPLFEKFESSVREVPFWQVEKLLKVSRFPFEVLSVSPQRLGTGTISQSHLGKVRFNDGREQEVVFKFIKPGAAERVLEELEIIRAACVELDENPEFSSKNYMKLAPLADNIYKMLVNDLKLKKSYAYQKLAIKHMTRDDIVIPEVWLSLEKEPNFMVQTKAEGQKLSKFEPEVAVKILNRLIEFWMDEAIFGDGYYHADLHQGNYFAKIQEEFKGHEKTIITLIDFGMFGELTTQDKKDIMALAITLKAKKVEELTTVAWRLANKSQSQITHKKLFLLLNERIREQEQDLSIDALLKLFTANGLELNQRVLGFLRGSVTLTSQLKKLDKRVSFADIALRVSLKHPLKALTVFSLKEVSFRDLVKLLWVHFFSNKQKAQSKKNMNSCVSFYGR